jgi:hypothetical protein
VKLSAVLRHYSTSTQYRVAQSHKVHDVSKLQFLQYSLYWNRSFAASATATDLSRQQRSKYWSYRVSVLQCPQHLIKVSNCLGNSVRSTDPTEAVRLGNNTHSEVLLTGPLTASAASDRTVSTVAFGVSALKASGGPLTGPCPVAVQQYLSKPGQYPIQASPFKGPTTVPKHGS